MPKEPSSLLFSAFRSLYGIAKTDGLTRLVAIVSLVIIFGSITGYVKFPWTVLAADIKSYFSTEGEGFVKSVNDNTNAAFQRVLTNSDKQTQATIQSCKMLAKAYHLSDEDCGK